MRGISTTARHSSSGSVRCQTVWWARIDIHRALGTAMSFLHTSAGVYLVRYRSKAPKLCGSVSATNTIPVSAPAMCAS